MRSHKKIGFALSMVHEILISVLSDFQAKKKNQFSESDLQYSMRVKSSYNVFIKEIPIFI